MVVSGLLLAAGAGRRFGGPKALAADAGGRSWLTRGVDVLRAGGCDDVVVVLGAEAERARPLVPEGARVVLADDWSEGMGASLRAGLQLPAPREVTSYVVMLVDLPDVGPEVVRRLVARAGPEALARATYDGVPGHPVLLGRVHWPAVAATATGDRGARDYLMAHPHDLVECGDLATGGDVDVRPPHADPTMEG